MSKTMNEEMVMTYVKDFLDFTEELPNDLSPMVSQLLGLDSKIRSQLKKVEHKMVKLAKTTDIQHKHNYSLKIEKYLKKVEKISEKKLKISAKLMDLIESKGKRLTEDYEGLLLSNQTESFTYGTRSGRMWTNSRSNQ